MHGIVEREPFCLNEGVVGATVNGDSPTHVDGGAIDDSLAVADQVGKNVREFIATESM
jgi:hypothetical protein